MHKIIAQCVPCFAPALKRETVSEHVIARLKDVLDVLPGLKVRGFHLQSYPYFWLGSGAGATDQIFVSTR